MKKNILFFIVHIVFIVMLLSFETFFLHIKHLIETTYDGQKISYVYMYEILLALLAALCIFMSKYVSFKIYAVTCLLVSLFMVIGTFQTLYRFTAEIWIVLTTLYVSNGIFYLIKKKRPDHTY